MASRAREGRSSSASQTVEPLQPLDKTVPSGSGVLIVWGQRDVKALALRSGETIWTYQIASDGDITSSAISDDERLYLSYNSSTPSKG